MTRLAFFLTLSVLLLAAPRAFADGLEGVYLDGDAELHVRIDGDGFGYIVERRSRRDGALLESGRAEVRDGALVARFDEAERTGTSMREGLSEINDGEREEDARIRPSRTVTILIPALEQQKLRELPGAARAPEPIPSESDRPEPQGQDEPAASPPPAFPIEIAEPDLEAPERTLSLQPAEVVEAPAPKDESPLLAGLALAVAAATAGAGASARGRAQATARGDRPGGTSTSAALAELEAFQAAPRVSDPVPADAEAKLLALALESGAEDVIWEEPALFEAADLQALTGSRGELSPAEKLVLDYTNLQILEGGADTDLRRNLEEVARWQPKQYSAEEAQRLDRRTSPTLSPIEAEALRYTNEQLLAGGPDVDLQRNYARLVDLYKETQARADAEALYEAMSGPGTNERDLFEALRGKTSQQVAALDAAFTQLLRERGERTHSGQQGSPLLRWIHSELGGGWRRKVLDAYNGERIKEDHEYFWTTATARAWNAFLKDSDAGAKHMIAHGNLLEQGIGHVNQAIFGGAGAVNDHVQYAQEFYVGQMQRSDSGAVQFLSKTGYVLATVGGSFGTKALDPTLSVAETEEGLVDLALLVGTFGAGKLVQASAKTALGARALARLSTAAQSLSRVSYNLRRVTGLARSATRTRALASNYSRIATAGKGLRAERAAEAARAYERAAKHIEDAEAALRRAKEAERIAREAMRAGGDVEAAARLTEEAVSAGNRAKRALEAARLAERQALEAARAASLLQTNALARGYDAAKARLTSPVGQAARARAAELSRMANQIDELASKDIARELKGILNARIGQARGPMTGRQFNELIDDLHAFADRNGIAITRTTNTAGVYPEGLYEIKLAGFDKVSKLDAPVSFKHRHELAHIVHTLQSRATIARSLSPSGARLTGEALRDAERFLETIENGGNYLEFEKAVTGIAGFLHRGERATDIALYGQRVDALIDGTRTGLQAGKVRFANGLTVEEAYATVLSKAPILTGKGLGELALTRLPPLTFATFYALDVDVSVYADLIGFKPEDLGIELEGGVPFRQLVDAIITEGIHPPADGR